MPTNELVFPSIELPQAWDRKKPGLKGPSVKFELRDEPTNANSGTHEKKITQFDGEYGDNNAEFWCQFEASLREVFLRKPCTNGPSKFGVLTSCLTGTALEDYRKARQEIGGHETNDNFESVLNKLKSEYFESDTP